MLRGAAATLTLAFVASACLVSNPRYCNDATPCQDPRWPVCDVPTRQCNEAGVDAGVDATAAEASSADGPCGVNQRWCNGACRAIDNPAHCGDACVACGGATPACGGTHCVCSATSCPTSDVCLGGECRPKECTTEAECVNPPACRVTAGATCNNFICHYAVASDGSACGGGQCCGGECVANDAAHCGPACLACTGATPDCSGTTCVCNGTSCVGGEVCSAGACVSGTCATAADCTTPPTCRTTVGAICNASNLCEFPLADDGTACNGTDHCCSGACVANDGQHCGATCGSCSGEKPSCNGTACVCTTLSCPDSLPACDANGSCRPCGAHAECEARDPQKPLCFGGLCQPSICGDGYPDTARGERCDDGLHENGDGCDPTCRYTGTVTTIAGKAGGGGYCDDDGTNARFVRLWNAAVVGTSVFLSDMNMIRQVALPDFSVTTFAGAWVQGAHADGLASSARFNRPQGLASDGTYLYIADSYNHVIRRAALSTGYTETIAGGVGQPGAAEGDGAVARFNFPYGLAYFENQLYVADSGNHSIRKVDLSTPAFVVSTWAGTSGSGGSANGNGSIARFSSPMGLFASGATLYVADSGNHTIRQITSTREVTTPAGLAGSSGSQDGVGNAARFYGPAGVAGAIYGGRFFLFVADPGNKTIRRIDCSTWDVTTLAGSAGQAGTADGIGANARFVRPRGVAAGAAFGSDVLVPDENEVGGSALRRVSAGTGSVVTVAGAGSAAGYQNGTGTDARFVMLSSVLSVGSDLLVSEQFNCVLRTISVPGGVVELAAGSPQSCAFYDGTGVGGAFQGPDGLAAAGGLAYVADRYAVREFDPASGAVVTRAGAGVSDYLDADGTAARFKSVQGAASDGTNVYLGDSCTIRRLTVGQLWTVAKLVGEPGSCVGQDGTGAVARLGSYLGLAVVGTTLYVADADNGALRAVDISNPAGPFAIQTIAGALNDKTSSADGVAGAARFRYPHGLAYDGISLFVGDRELIRQVDLSTMRVTTLVGRQGCTSVVDGDHTRAALSLPTGITYSAATNSLFYVEPMENVVREVR